MTQYRKKPIVIEAIQWNGRNYAEIIQFAGGDDSLFTCNITDKLLNIQTLEGDMIASEGDWIIRGIKGEFYPCKPDIFEATYEKAIKDINYQELKDYVEIAQTDDLNELALTYATMKECPLLAIVTEELINRALDDSQLTKSTLKILKGDSSPVAKPDIPKSFT